MPKHAWDEIRAHADAITVLICQSEDTLVRSIARVKRVRSAGRAIWPQSSTPICDAIGPEEHGPS
jgi:hypothetical protein